MPMSEAAMDGIRDNGNRWKYELRLSDLTQKLGAFEANAPESEVETVTSELIDRLRHHVGHHPDRPYSHPLILAVEDLFSVADCGIEEVRFALTDIYDIFDYHRVLVL